MKFKVGSLAKIQKTAYRCTGCGGNHGRYVHGEKLDNVPLNTRGKVVRVAEDGLILKVFDNVEIKMSPEELSLSLEARTTDSLKGIPVHPLLEMISSSPAIVADENLYLIQGQPEGNNIVNLGKQAYGLSNPIPLSSLDDLFFQRAEQDLSRWREDYAKEILDSINTDTKIGDPSDIPQRIYQEVFPYFRDNKKEKIARVLGQEIKNQYKKKIEQPELPEEQRKKIISFRVGEMRREIEEIRRTIYAPEVEEVPVEPRSRKEIYLDRLLDTRVKEEPYHPITFVGKAVGRPAVLFNEGRAFALDQVRKVNNRTSIPFIISGRGYALGAELSRDSLDKYLAENLLERQVDETFSVNLSEEKLREIAASQVANLPSFANLTEYEEGEVGFIKNDEQWYATLRVPAFAVQSKSDNNYYLFDTTRIAMPVRINGGELIPGGRVYVVENNNHPLLNEYHNNGNTRKSFSWLCLGHNNLPSGNQAAEEIAKGLQKAKDIFKLGFRDEFQDMYVHQELCNCRACGINHYKDHIRTLKQLEDANIPILGAVGAKRK